MFGIRGCKKGLARGDERGLRVASRSRRPLRRRSEGRRRTAISCPFYASGPRVRQTRYQKATHAHLQGVGALEEEFGGRKKRGSIRRWSPMKVVANGRGRRKRRLPLDLAEGGGFSSVQCLCSAGPREEGSVRRLSDRLNMLAPVLFGNAWVRMSAMRPVRGRSAYLTHFVAGGRMARSAVSHKLSKAESRNDRKSFPVL